MLEVFRSRRMAAVAFLGFYSGLPLYLTSRVLQAWLTINKVDLTAIGLFSLASLPYSLKFLWAPLTDRFSIPGFGRRKGWLFASQAALTIAIAAMALHDPRTALQGLAINAILLSFFSATQDITIDAYRFDILRPDEITVGAALNVMGYRIALILTGSVSLVLADHVSWPSVYLLIAFLMAIGMFFSTRVPDPPYGRPPESLRDAVKMPFVDFFSRKGTSGGALILGFVVLFRLGDSMIANMTTPFLLQIGFTQTDVGAVQGGMGLAARI